MKGWLNDRGEWLNESALPLPPPNLRILVAGTADRDWFIASGEAAAAAVTQGAALVEATLAGKRVLELGCGCGRVLRHLVNAGADLHGCDYNARLIAWSTRNLPFGTFTVNEQEPPLRFRADEFDLAYAISVFTHLAGPMQRPWLNELARITKPGGLILITTHGDSHYPGLTATEQARFNRGEIVVRNSGASGMNLCAVYHPKEAVSDLAAQVGLTPVGLLPVLGESVLQDLHVLRL